MSVNKRKKNSRLQGSNTHGWGRNQHRKAGSRGGVGNAGTGKKCHANKPSVWHKDYLGKSGFVRKRSVFEPCCISIADVEDKLPKWKRDKRVSERDGLAVVDLKVLGYDCLLGNGKVVTKLKVIVPRASDNAVSKIKEAGGEVLVSKSA